MKISVKKDKFEIFANVIKIGKDYVVIVGGGKEHIGAVAVAQPNININEPQKPSATTSVITLIGHKEDAVAQKIAQTLSKKLQTNFVVIVGLHWDNIMQEQIALAMDLVDDLMAKIILDLS